MRKNSILIFSIFGKKCQKMRFFTQNHHESHPETYQVWYQIVENLICFKMTLNLWRLDVFNKFYAKNLNFYQNGGHFGRHLGFGGVRNKFFEVDLLNIVCYALSLKINMVYLVCTDGETNSKTKHVFGVWPSDYKVSCR